jgi:hypothetical protein
MGGLLVTEKPTRGDESGETLGKCGGGDYREQMYTMDENGMTAEVVQPTRRRRHGNRFRAEVIRTAVQPSVSTCGSRAALSRECQHAAQLGRRQRRPQVDEYAVGKVCTVAAKTTAVGVHN